MDALPFGHRSGPEKSYFKSKITISILTLKTHYETEVKHFNAEVQEFPAFCKKPFPGIGKTQKSNFLFPPLIKINLKPYQRRRGPKRWADDSQRVYLLQYDVWEGTNKSHSFLRT
ncbi:hypothetical protein AVEN_183268-1 [Araneus ventricosus]|uniref:Uncharacterized protein n=1 Tax=Araneus ventricosus TaxID=182803 RepID=A0A4Y2IKA0_ARAVE|nr:hypothetical protein AVEN_183268-1 [Araneus ventricosus]